MKHTLDDLNSASKKQSNSNADLQCSLFRQSATINTCDRVREGTRGARRRFQVMELLWLRICLFVGTCLGFLRGDAHVEWSCKADSVLDPDDKVMIQILGIDGRPFGANAQVRCSQSQAYLPGPYPKGL